MIFGKNIHCEKFHPYTQNIYINMYYDYSQFGMYSNSCGNKLWDWAGRIHHEIVRSKLFTIHFFLIVSKLFIILIYSSTSQS